MKNLCLVCLAVLMALQIPTACAETYPLGVEAFGGWDMPVIQEDIASGPLFGLSVRGHLLAFLHGQLLFSSTSQGDEDKSVTPFGEASFTETLTGGTLTSIGARVLFAGKNPAPIWPYGFIGISTNNFAPGERDKETLLGTSWGGGVAFSVYRDLVYVDLSTSLLVMPIADNKASRKKWQTSLGLMYLFHIPMK
jgi:hypothetical protein